MRWRLALIVLFVVAGSIGVGVGVGARARAAQPEVACALPGMVFCSTDQECVGFGATCDTTAQSCVCLSTDGGGDLGGGDLGAVDLATPPANHLGGAGSTVGGGMSGPPKSSGCSFVPGSL